MNPYKYDKLGFQLMDYKIIPKKWGYERVVVNDPEGYTGKILVVAPNGMACSIHYHRVKTETFHVTKGTLYAAIYEPLPTLDKRKPDIKHFRAEPHLITLQTGRSLRLPTWYPHRFWTKDEIAEFIEFSTIDNPDDSFRFVESGPLPPHGSNHALY